MSVYTDDDIDAELIRVGYSRAGSIMRGMRNNYEAELARLRKENERLRDALKREDDVAFMTAATINRLRHAIWDLESAWFDYCQGVRPDVPEREIYDLLAINDGRLTMAEIEAQRNAPAQVQEES